MQLLGYTGLVDGQTRYTIASQRTIEDDGRRPDAVLGDFNGNHRPLVAVEGKGTKDPLDRPYDGRRLSAVQQCYEYAINLRCDWILVTSMRQTRLYYKGADQLTFEQFDTEALDGNEFLLRQFVFLLGAERIVPASGRCHLYDLLAESKRVGAQLTKQFYVKYADIRQDTFVRLCQDNPAVPRKEVLACAQKILDRVLFCAFAEDRGLLPVETLRKAYEHRDDYAPKPIWDTFRGLFRSINRGNAALRIHAYNGGLFANDATLDGLVVADEVCRYFRDFGDYDYRPAQQVAGSHERGQIVDVDILGHIFEQSIMDLERLRNELDGLVQPVGIDQHKTRRKKEGAFYTPAFITRYIVEQSLGRVLQERFEQLRRRHLKTARGTAKTALEDPSVYVTNKLKRPAREALIQFWESWQDELTTIRILDPACGSGAFLIQAFDGLFVEYQASNERLRELRGHRSLFDVDKRILENNLYGVDINEEAVEICRLSLWIKTAHAGKQLTSLDHSIRIGNSVVTDPEVDSLAFDWQKQFAEVFKAGGFDVVVANPPYIRQEWLTQFKPHWQQQFKSYHGTADIFAYFYELGVNVLRDGGRLGFITSGTFARANFAGPFRSWLPTVARIERLVNFGENQPFEEAEMVYPTIAIVRKDTQPTTFKTLFIRDEVPASLDEAVKQDGVECDDSVYAEAEWRFQLPGVSRLFSRLMSAGKPMLQLDGIEGYRGVLTGFNEAFILDQTTKARLVAEDGNCQSLFQKIVQGRDLRPWYVEDENRFLLLIPSSANVSWPWTDSGDDAENSFAKTYPSVHGHLLQHKEKLIGRCDKGLHWWELRACAYYDAFTRSKIVWPEMAKLPRFSWDDQGMLVNNKGFFLATEEPWLLSVLQSRVQWFCISQLCVPLRLRGGLWQYQCEKQSIDRLRIPDTSKADKTALSKLARQATQLAQERYQLHQNVRHRILADLGSPTAALNQKLTAWWRLDVGEFRTEVKKAFQASIPVAERGEWERAMSDWKREHAALTELLVAVEEEANDRVYHLFSMSKSEIQFLEEHARHAMIDYRYGEP
ncbi:MAG: N-6 DNA methylase [Planctomycetota bacterium]|nr:N-6 DNA methylase [Planctomycetota bacterium]